MTEKYAHILQENKQKAIDNISEFFAKKIEQIKYFSQNS